jgi:hypothetical protein
MAHTRGSREQDCWDYVYRCGGPDVQKSWWKHVENVSYVNEFFYGLVGHLSGKKVLSIGGGIDRLALSLARSGNEVVSVDVSPAATARTRELARQAGLEDRLVGITADCEEACFQPEGFDVAVCKRAPHHMDLGKVLTLVHNALVTGGLFLAEEPVCLLRLLQWIHVKLPFYPDTFRTEDERELTGHDLTLIQAAFADVRFHYFNLMTRESVAYFFHKGRMDRLLKPVGRIDYFLVNRCLPVLRFLSTYAVIQAVK